MDATSFSVDVLPWLYIFVPIPLIVLLESIVFLVYHKIKGNKEAIKKYSKRVLVFFIVTFVIALFIFIIFYFLDSPFIQFIEFLLIYDFRDTLQNIFSSIFFYSILHIPYAIYLAFRKAGGIKRVLLKMVIVFLVAIFLRYIMFS